MENIKDYILISEEKNEETKEEKKRENKKSIVEYSTAFVSGPDFGVRRKTKKTSKVFVCIVSAGQYYIKNELTGDIQHGFTPEIVNSFFADTVDGYTFSEGERPTWIDTIQKGTFFANYFMQFLESEGIRELITKNLISFTTLGRYITCRGDFNVSELESIEKCLQNFADKDLIKKTLGDMYIGLNPENHKISRCLEFARKYISYFKMTDSLFTFLQKKIGYDGIRTIIDSFMESPSSFLPNSDEWARLFELAEENNISFEIHRLCEYMFYESYRQGFTGDDRYSNHFFMNYFDTLSLQLTVYGKIKDKYPKNLLSYHLLLSAKANEINQVIDKKKWEIQVSKMKAFEWENDKYKFICPKTKEDMVNEARQQSNCLSSYINSVINGKCMIFFMRKKQAITNSFITIELRNDLSLGQVKRAFNKNPDAYTMEIVHKWYSEAVRKEA